MSSAAASGARQRARPQLEPLAKASVPGTSSSTRSLALPRRATMGVAGEREHDRARRASPAALAIAWTSARGDFVVERACRLRGSRLHRGARPRAAPRRAAAIAARRRSPRDRSGRPMPGSPSSASTHHRRGRCLRGRRAGRAPRAVRAVERARDLRDQLGVHHHVVEARRARARSGRSRGPARRRCRGRAGTRRCDRRAGPCAATTAVRRPGRRHHEPCRRSGAASSNRAAARSIGRSRRRRPIKRRDEADVVRACA